jgi:hypothetical protein
MNRMQWFSTIRPNNYSEVEMLFNGINLYNPWLLYGQDEIIRDRYMAVNWKRRAKDKPEQRSERQIPI